MRTLRRFTHPTPTGMISRRTAGMTLVELLIAMALAIVITGLTVSVFIVGMQKFRDIDARQTKQNQIQVATEQISKSLRVADTPDPVAQPSPFVTITPTVLEFYSNTNPANTQPLKVKFSLDNAGTLTQQTSTPTYNASTGTWTYGAYGTARTLAKTVPATGTDGTALFTYYDGTGNPIAVPGTGMSATDRGNIRSVGVRVTDNSFNGIYQQRVWLVNLS